MLANEAFFDICWPIRRSAIYMLANEGFYKRGSIMSQIFLTDRAPGLRKYSCTR